MSQVEFGGALDTVEFNGIEYDSSHGGPFDRGSADSYYNRKVDPHYWPFGTYKGTRIEAKNMTPAEITAYMAGYEFNEQCGGKKEW